MSVYKDEKTNEWYFKKRIRKCNGKLTSTTRRGFKTKNDAKKAEALFEFTSNKSSELIYKICDEYLVYLNNKVKYSTLYAKKTIINKYIRNYFGEKFPEEVSNIDVLNWQNQLMNEGVKQARVNKIHSELQLLFDYIGKFHNYTGNPARAVGTIKLTQSRNNKMLIWTPEEFNKFISLCEDETYYVLFNLLFYTGMRKGEAMALTWDDINQNTKQINVSKTISPKHATNSKIKYLVTTPKTSSSIRTIDLPNELFDILMNYKNHQIEISDTLKSSDLIFGRDRPLATSPMTRYKNKIAKKAGVKQIRIHDFRHSHASLLINMGINPLFISERLGHKNVSTTLDIYSHLFPTNQKEIVNKLSNLMKN